MAALTFEDITTPKPPPPTQQGSVVDFSDLAPATAATTASRNFRTSTGAPQPGQQTNDWKPVTWTGTGKAGATGGRNLVEGTVAMAGDVPGMAGGVTGWLANKLGVKDAEGYGKAAEEGVRSAIDPLAKIHAVAQLLGYKDSDIPGPSRLFPTSGDIASVTDPAVTAVSPTAEDWTRHRAENPVEGITQGTVEFGPGMLTGRGEAGLVRRFATNVAAPAVGGEVGGEVGKALGNETLGRLIGSAGMSVVPGITRRVVSGAPVTGERATLARLMQNEGIDLTAGDIRGGGAKFLESGLFGGKPGALADEQKAQLNQAVMQRAPQAFAGAENLAPHAMEQAQQHFDNTYDSIVARNNGVPLDNQLQADVVGTADNYHRLKALPPNAPSIVNDYLGRISDAANAGGGTIPPDVFRTLRNDISKSIRDTKDFETQNALRDFRDHMYNSIGRNGQPDLVNELQQTNRQYRNFKIIEDAMSRAGNDAVLGNVPAGGLLSAVKAAEGKTGYTQGHGDFNDLARGSSLFLKDVQNSGTPGRTGPMFLGAALGHALSQAQAGDFKQALASAGGALAPTIARQVVTSGPVRRMAVNNMLNPQPMMDPVVQALLARQAASLSGGGQ